MSVVHCERLSHQRVTTEEAVHVSYDDADVTELVKPESLLFGVCKPEDFNVLVGVRTTVGFETTSRITDTTGGAQSTLVRSTGTESVSTAYFAKRVLTPEQVAARPSLTNQDDLVKEIIGSGYSRVVLTRGGLVPFFRGDSLRKDLPEEYKKFRQDQSSYWKNFNYSSEVGGDLETPGYHKPEALKVVTRVDLPLKG